MRAQKSRNRTNKREVTYTARYEKILKDVLSGDKDGNIRFDDLCGLLEKLGFKLKV